jgi:glycosyltransferase involved in cell wall biosynthesis
MNLNILMVTRTTPFHSIGGMQSICWDLAREFVRLGHKVTVLTTSLADVAHQEEQLVGGVKIVFLKGTQPEKYSLSWWRLSKQYVRQGMMDEVDLVFGVSAAAAGIADDRARFTRSPVFVFQAHGTSWGEIVSKWASRRPVDILKSVKNIYWLFKDGFIYPKFDYIVAVGESVGRSMLDLPLRWMTGHAKIATILNGVDTATFKPDTDARVRLRASLGIDESALVVVFAARLHSQKGGAEAVRGFAKWKEMFPEAAGAKLLIIGGGAEQHNMHSIAVDLGVDNDAIFAGAVAREDMPGLLAASDIFLFPSLRREGLPMNILEALATGLPCVTSDDLREVLGEGLSVIYMDPRSPEAISVCLHSAISSDRPRESMLSKEYTLSYCAQRYIDLANATQKVNG